MLDWIFKIEDKFFPSNVAIFSREPPFIVIAFFIVIGVPFPINVFPSKLIIEDPWALFIKVCKSLNVLEFADKTSDFKLFLLWTLELILIFELI